MEVRAVYSLGRRRLWCGRGNGAPGIGGEITLFFAIPAQ